MTVKRRRIISLAAAVIMVLSLLPGTAIAAQDTFSGTGSGTKASPYEIATAAQLNEVRNNLSANYVLTADIDLSGYKSWDPIGSFAPVDENNPETPQPAFAFTGTFDGMNHTVSGLSITKQDGFAVGLFGCSANATIKNLIITNANVAGNMMVGAGVGFAYKTIVDNLDLAGENAIAGKSGADGAPNDMMAGIVGAGMDVTIKNCDITGSGSALTTVTGTDGSQNIGLIGGGLESGTITDCTVTAGKIVSGVNSRGIGGLSGCAMEFDEVSGCTVSGVTITVGDGAYIVGGLTGYTGKSEGNRTDISDCSANVSITAGKNSSRIGGLIGGGFFLEEYIAYYPVPTSFNVNNCKTDGALITGAGSSAIGTIVGNTYQSPLKKCSSTMTINGASGGQIGADTQLDSLAGSYKPAFVGGMLEEKFNHYWHDYCSAILGESEADTYIAATKAMCSGPVSVIGGDGSTGEFNFGFYDKDKTGIASFTFDGMEISGYKADGTQIFSHTYQYVETDAIYAGGEAMMPDMALFETTDANAGEFKYFYIAPDTPATTFHIEFRYGSNLSDLKQMMSGEYGWWAAAGIPAEALTDPKETMIEQVISLFCLENMDYSSARSVESLLQLGDLVGTWDCDVSAYPEFAKHNIDALYITIGANGAGTTYAKIDGSFVITDTYDAFLYMSSPNSGVYAAHTKDGETEGCHITFYDNGEKMTLVTLTGDEISYTKRVGFSDVATGAYYADAVAWAVSKNITNGTGATTFSPDGTCTRAQVVTFLWRAMGSPEPKNIANPFSDIDSSAYYYKAVLWAVEQGITNGTSATAFSPDSTVTRAQAVTFQWRAAKSPASAAANPFADVPLGEYYSSSVVWAVNMNITNGTGETTFSPNDNCTRAQIVTFLYRQLAA